MDMLKNNMVLSYTEKSGGVNECAANRGDRFYRIGPCGADARGGLLEAVLAPLTRLAAGVMGRDNDVDTTLARMELGWRSTVPYDEAMERIGAWVKKRYA